MCRVRFTFDGLVKHVGTTIDGRQTGKTLRQVSETVDGVQVGGLSVVTERVHVELSLGDGLPGGLVQPSFVTVEAQSVSDDVLGGVVKTVLLDQSLSRRRGIEAYELEQYKRSQTSMSLGVLFIKLVTEDEVVLKAVLLKESQERRAKSFLLGGRDLHDFTILKHVASVNALELKISRNVGVKEKLNHLTCVRVRMSETKKYTPLATKNLGKRSIEYLRCCAFVPRLAAGSPLSLKYFQAWSRVKEAQAPP